MFIILTWFAYILFTFSWYKLYKITLDRMILLSFICILIGLIVFSGLLINRGYNGILDIILRVFMIICAQGGWLIGVIQMNNIKWYSYGDKQRIADTDNEMTDIYDVESNENDDDRDKLLNE